MRIRRLKLSGFKSFVEPSELRIEPGLTGVVGPNGCGKSNLLEAIRWVMGEGSPKSLRGGGMDDVIFAGTASRPPRDSPKSRSSSNGTRMRKVRLAKARSRAGSSVALVPPIGSTARTSAPRMFPCCLRTPPRARIRRRWSARARSVDHLRQAHRAAAPSGGSGRHFRLARATQGRRAEASRDGSQPARLGELLSDQEQRASQLRRQARAAERYRQLSDKIRSAEARLVHARWVEADRAATAARQDAKTAETDVASLQGAMANAQQAQEPCRGAWTTAQ